MCYIPSLRVLSEDKPPLASPRWGYEGCQAMKVLGLPALRWAGFSVAPADADPAVRARVDWVTPSGGGCGAVRETVEMILRSSGAWTRVTAEYHGGDDR